MIVDPQLVAWLSGWENPQSLSRQELTDYEWGFLKSLQKKYAEFFHGRVCPAVEQYVRSSNIGFYHEGKLCEFSAQQHLFINSIQLTRLRECDEWEIAYANRLDYTIIHVYLRGEEIAYVACTF